MKIVAFIPLRAGGKRVGLIGGRPKEYALFAGHSLMAYTICAAKQSQIFDEIIAIARDKETIEIAEKYGAIVPFKRPKYTVENNSPDIEWVQWATEKYGDNFDVFSILRVTSPFRNALDIRKAWHKFYDFVGADSLRMVRPVAEHPGKMWIEQNNVLLPLLPMQTGGVPWHSQATQGLFKAYIQTAGMEFAYFDTVRRTGSISGSVIVPYISDYWAGFDINTREEWFRAENAALAGIVKLPEVR